MNLTNINFSENNYNVLITSEEEKFLEENGFFEPQWKSIQDTMYQCQMSFLVEAFQELAKEGLDQEAVNIANMTSVNDKCLFSIISISLSKENWFDKALCIANQIESTGDRWNSEQSSAYYSLYQAATEANLVELAKKVKEMIDADTRKMGEGECGG